MREMFGMTDLVAPQSSRDLNPKKKTSREKNKTKIWGKCLVWQTWWHPKAQEISNRKKPRGIQKKQTNQKRQRYEGNVWYGRLAGSICLNVVFLVFLGGRGGLSSCFFGLRSLELWGATKSVAPSISLISLFCCFFLGFLEFFFFL